MHFIDALRSRKSVRAFRSDPVPRALVEELLSLASRAPCGQIFTIDKELDAMSFVDLEMFMQTLMLAAKVHGLDTCAQGAWNNYWSVTRKVLSVPDDQYIICGISLGYADETAPVNTLVSEREPVDSFATFHGF